MIKARSVQSLRQTKFIVLIRLFFVNLVLIGLILFLFTYPTDLSRFLILLTIIADLFVSLFVYLSWTNNQYQINTEKITHIYGIFWHRHQVYRFLSLDSFSIRQGLVGQILNYGTIYLKSSETGQSVFLKNIPQPHYYLTIIKKALPEAEQA